MAKYSKKAQQKVEKAMHEKKRGKLKSGRNGKTVKSRKQAIAIGLSEARKEGAKVPAKKKSTSTGNKKTATKKTARKTTTASRRPATKKTPAKKKVAPKKTGRKIALKTSRK